MPSVVSEETRLARLERYASQQYVDIAYRVRDVESGRMGALHGGRWHVHQRRYLAPWELRYHELSAQTEEELERARLHVVTRDVHGIQFEAIEDVVTKILLSIGSRRGGKSRGNAIKAGALVADHPTIGGEVLAPTYDKLQIMWRYVLDALPPHWIERTREDEHFIELVTGPRIKFISTHRPDAVIGEGVGWALFDELQSISEQAWSLALPAVSDGGSAFQVAAAGTPRMGEFKQRYERIRKLAEEDPRTARILHFTYRNNSFIETGDGTIFDLQRSLADPRKVAQELEAEFVSEEGLVYYRFDRAVHDRSWEKMQRRRATPWAEDITSGWVQGEVDCEIAPKYVIGVDYGINRNFAVVYKVVKVGGHVCLWAIREVYGDRNYSVDQLANDIIDRGYYPALVIDDASGPKSDGGKRALFEWEAVQVRGRGQVFEVHHYRSNPDVADRVDSVNALMGNSLGTVRWFVDVAECSRLVECLENQELENGKPRRSKKNEVSYHDMPDAAGYPCIYLFPATVPYEREERLREAA